MEKDRIKLIPIAFVLGYIPLIVRLHVYDSHFESLTWFPAWEDGVMYDFFLYFKATAVIITAVIMLLILLYDLMIKKKYHLTLSHINLTLLGYLLFVFISGLLSEYRTAAFMGSAESFESVPVILSYGVFFAYSYTFVKDKNTLNKVLMLSVPGFVLIGITGILQLLKADPFKSSIIKSVIIPARYASAREGLSFAFKPGEVYGTLYNSNYVPLYFGFGVFLGLYFLFFNKNIKIRLAGLVCFLLSLCSIIGSDSRTGYIAIIVSVIFFAYFITRCFDGKIAKICGKIILITTVAIIIFLLVFVYTGNADAYLQKAGFVKDDEQEYLIEGVKTETNGVWIKIKGNAIRLSYEVEGEKCSIDLEDENGKEPAYELTDDMSGYILKDERFEGISIYPVYVKDRVCLDVKADGRDLVFLNSGNEQGYLYYNNAGKFTDFKQYNRNRLFRDTLFSDRGLLWNNCLELLPKSILLGSGSGTFVYVYPNDDDYYRLYNDTGFNFYDVKAHSLYFQQFIENGGIAFLLFMIFCISVSAVVLRSKEPENIAILTGLICYMICSLTVDSNVNTAPGFWVLSGSLVGMSHGDRFRDSRV